MEKTRRYSIEIKDIEDKTTFFTAADWSDEELQIVVAQIMRLAGLPDDGLSRPPERPEPEEP
jgi:hypothetical protein